MTIKNKLMKKIYSFLVVSLLTASASAQLTTNDKYDVNADGKVSVGDATEIVSYNVSGKGNEHKVVDAAALHSVLKSIDSQLGGLANIENSMTTVEGEFGISPEELWIHNGHELVDLGTGVKWATMNLGASSPEDYGDYFAWAETTGYKPGTRDFDFETYKWISTSGGEDDGWLMKYTFVQENPLGTDKKASLDLEDDAAHVNWGGNWRMPTDKELNKLITDCYWQWVASYNGKDVSGYIVYKAKHSGDKGKFVPNVRTYATYSLADPHIFLPAAGRISGKTLIKEGTEGNYWSSKLNQYDLEDGTWEAYTLEYGISFEWNEYDVDMEHSARCRGLSIRAVCP